MNKSDPLFMISVRMCVLISLCAMSGPSSMSDSNIALMFSFDALSELLKAVASISAFLSVLSDNYAVRAGLKRSHSTGIIAIDT